METLLLEEIMIQRKQVVLILQIEKVRILQQLINLKYFRISKIGFKYLEQVFKTLKI
jgi:hypothetical protein